MKRLPPHRRIALIGSCLFVLGGSISVSLLYFLGEVTESSSIASAVGIFSGAIVWGLAWWFDIGMKGGRNNAASDKKPDKN